jgi:hypothetical protein
MKPCKHPKRIRVEERVNKKGITWYWEWCYKCKKDIYRPEMNMNLFR